MGPTPIAILLALAPQFTTTQAPDRGSAQHIARLSARIDQAEETFRERLEDLAAVDVRRAARPFDRELRRLEREADCLRAAGLTNELERQLKFGVFDALHYSRSRLIQIEAVGVAAQQLSGLLTEMRDSLRSGRPERALDRYETVLRGDRANDLTQALLRRQLTAIEAERQRAQELLALAQPR